MKQWFVIYSRSSQERIAEGNLQAQGFETYLPRLACRKTQARRSLVVTVPMFPRYFFVRADLDASRWRSIYGTFGVATVVSFGDRPAAVPDAVIEELRMREDSDGIIRLPKEVAFNAGDQVQITDGPLSDVAAMVAAKSDRDRVFVLMSILGQQVKVRVGNDRLRRAS
ncbi:transcription termination/antitermination protein NusG [Hwanghaeella sp. LZ110]|jgi:transcriptional antiterminator RfaH|uniref:transcription termination/antitermination protein NusG n=1 Tax=Hwanghaeella sp. LZ110 TaxID=3402810 RepID=UPI003B66FB1D